MKAFTLFLVSLLSHDDFATREAATNALVVACAFSPPARAALPAGKDPETRRRLAYVHEVLWFQFLPEVTRELCAGPWHFNPDSPEGQNNARFTFFPDGSVEYRSAGAVLFPRGGQLGWQFNGSALHVFGAFEEHYVRAGRGWKHIRRNLSLMR